jgi:hypothetical protein
MNLRRLLRQTAVYWASPVSDGYGGHSYADPVEVPCRWEPSSKRFSTAQGEEFVASAVVWVAEDLEVGGLLFLGSLSDLTGAQESNPQPVASALAVRAFEQTPDVRGAIAVRRAIL